MGGITGVRLLPVPSVPPEPPGPESGSVKDPADVVEAVKLHNGSKRKKQVTYMQRSQPSKLTPPRGNTKSKPGTPSPFSQNPVPIVKLQMTSYPCQEPTLSRKETREKEANDAGVTK